jgi:cytochrome-b5 reductase
VGETIAIKGPFKKLEYITNMKENIGMIAGGTGIAPMIQMLQAIFQNPEDTTKVYMVYANIAEEDILCKEMLDTLEKQFPERFQVFYTLDKPSPSWTGGKGFITPEMAKQNLPAPSQSNLILFCGPPPMCKAIVGEKAPDYSQGEVGGVAAQLGYTKEMVYKF